jgi:hypothetical protein
MKRTDKDLIAEAYRPIYEMAFGIAPDASAQKSITQEELMQLIKDTETNRPGTNFISVTQVTKEASNKAPYPPFVLPGLKNGKSYFAKVSQVNGEIGSNYGEKMRRQQTQQGMEADFVAKASPYNSVEGSPSLREKDGQYYIQYYPRSVAKKFAPVIVKANKDKPTSEADFEVTSKADVAQYKGPARPPQQVEVTTRVVSLASIAAAKINKQEYVITDIDPIRKAIWEISGAPMPEEETVDSEPTETPTEAPAEPPVNDDRSAYRDNLARELDRKEAQNVHDIDEGGW